MGTMAMFWDADPLEGGRPCGWFGMDGHPDRFPTLATADSAAAFGRRVGGHSRRQRFRPTWVKPLPGCWGFWPSAGLMVMDYGYWFDGKSGRTMLVNYQSAAVPFLPGMEEDSEAWPCVSRDGADTARRFTLLPEVHATVAPDAVGDFHRYTCSSVPLDLLLEAAAARGRGLTVRRALENVPPGGVAHGLWAPAGTGGGFEIEDTAGSGRVGHARLADASEAALAAFRLDPAPNGDVFRCYKRYSTEALLDEAAAGTATLATEGGSFDIEIVHPEIGSVRAEGDSLPHVVLEMRRKLHADPRFRLANPPPHR